MRNSLEKPRYDPLSTKHIVLGGCFAIKSSEIKASLGMKENNVDELFLSGSVANSGVWKWLGWLVGWSLQSDR